MEQRTCEACGGCGYILVGAGFAALESRYPELPIREMAQRGWLRDVGDGEDVALCDAAFLRFWEVETHAGVLAKMFPHRQRPGMKAFVGKWPVSVSDADFLKRTRDE